MKSYSDISKRYMKQNKKRSILTIFGITLAVVLVFAVGTFGFSFFDAMIEHERNKSGWEFAISGIDNNQVEKVMNNVEVKDSALEKRNAKTYIIKDMDQTATISFMNSDYYDRLFNNEDLIKGNKPSNENEILISSFYSEKFNLGIGDKITLLNDENQEQVYTISGLSRFDGYVTGGSLSLQGYLDDNNLKNDNDYAVYINLKAEKGKQDVIKKVTNDAEIVFNETTLRHDNNELLYLTGNGGSSIIGKSITGIAVFVISIIVVCTITVIYNSFNISVIERMRYFGILKAIGATPRQIKNIIFKEGLLMGIVALPIGCLIGFFALKYGIKIFIGNTMMLMFEDFSINFYPSILGITVLIEAITIFISLIIPARKAKKVSAIDAMRNKNEIKIGKIKRRKGKLVQKIFGIEGNIAYKNIRRTPARFIVTIIALTISIVLFNVFYGFIDYAKQIVSQQFMNMKFESQLSKQDGDTSFTQDEIDGIRSLDFIDDYYLLNAKNFVTTAIESSKINQDYETKTKYEIGTDIYDALNYQRAEATVYVGDDKKTFDVVNESLTNKVSMDEMDDGGVILIDGATIVNEDKKKEVVRITNYKVGDTIKLPKTDDTTEEGVRKAIESGNFYEAKVVAITNLDPFIGVENVRSLGFIFSSKGYEKINKKVMPNGFCINFNGNDKDREEAAKYFAENAEKSGYRYQDIGDAMKEVNNMYSQVEFFVYSFVIIVSIISIVNIFNTISTSILLRKKEFSTLKAIGMTEGQLRKSVILEGTLYGIISATIGGILSAVLLKVMINLGGGLGTAEYNFPFIAFSLSIIVAILITYFSTLVPLSRLKKFTIVEGISDDE